MDDLFLEFDFEEEPISKETVENAKPKGEGIKGQYTYGTFNPMPGTLDEFGNSKIKPLNPLFTEDRICAICHCISKCHTCCKECPEPCNNQTRRCENGGYDADMFYLWKNKVQKDSDYKEFKQYFIEKPYEPRTL